MTQVAADGSLQGRSQMGKSDQLVVKGECDYDISEYAYTNRELVNLENANVNIDNSTDVIIGPVTQFNVSGNVTIVQNGTARDGPEGKEGQEDWNPPADEKCTNVKLQRPEKSLSEDQDSKKVLIKKCVIGVAVLTVTIGAILLATLLKTPNSDTVGHEIIVPISPQANQTASSNVTKHTIFTKEDWGGRAPRSYENFTHPPKRVVVKHIGAGGMCSSFRFCAARISTIQSTNMADGLPDVYCNFFVGGDGNIYVGRGWDVQPEYNRDVIDVVFIGNFEIDTPTKAMTDGAKALLEFGMNKGKLDRDYIVVAHNQTYNTRSPGVNLYKEVTTWPHYDSGLYFGNSLD